MRGVAILLVVSWHIFAPPLRYQAPWTNKIFQMTWTGVDLFFVLSGFLIGGILLRNRDTTNLFTVFYARRFLRILPLYIAAIVIFLMLAAGTEPIWSLLTFTQNILWAVEGRFGHQTIGVTWSLALEEQFYLVLPLLIRLLPVATIPYVLGALILTAPALRTGMYAISPATFFPSYMLLPTRMDSLFLGVLIAWMLANDAPRAWFMQRRQWAKLVVIPLLTGMVAFSIMEIPVGARSMFTIGFSWIALTYALMVVLTLTSTRRLPSAIEQPLVGAGIACYSLYLFHIPLYAAMVKLYPFSVLPSHFVFHVVYSLVLAGVGWLCFVAVERPCVRFGHGRFRYVALSTPPVQSPDVGIHAADPFSQHAGNIRNRSVGR